MTIYTKIDFYWHKPSGFGEEKIKMLKIYRQ